YELKQGILTLGPADRKIDEVCVQKICKTIVAIANNGFQREGKIIIGVADKERDAKRIEGLDGVSYSSVGGRFVVGVMREAKELNKTAEEYFTLWKERIKASKISEPLKGQVLSALDFNNYYGF